jgi:hypothetical protein
VQNNDKPIPWWSMDLGSHKSQSPVWMPPAVKQQNKTSIHTKICDSLSFADIFGFQICTLLYASQPQPEP